MSRTPSRPVADLTDKERAAVKARLRAAGAALRELMSTLPRDSRRLACELAYLVATDDLKEDGLATDTETLCRSIARNRRIGTATLFCIAGRSKLQSSGDGA